MDDERGDVPADESIDAADRQVGDQGQARVAGEGSDGEALTADDSAAELPDLDGTDDEPADLVGASSRVRESVSVGAAAGSARAAARRAGAVAASGAPTKGAATRPREADRPRRDNLFTNPRRFLREVVAELRKVIWPARHQMITYTIVVIVFVVFMVALVAGLDVLFAKGVLTVFKH